MKTLKILVLCVLLSTVSMAKKEALIVAVSNYSGVKHDFDEKAIWADVEMMQKVFKKKWDFNVTVLFNEKSMELENELQKYSETLGKDDKFIFYFSGHGSRTPDKNNDEKEDNLDEVLVLSNGQKNLLFVDDTLNGYLNSIKAKKLILLDSCHSASAFKAFGKNRYKGMPEIKNPELLGQKSFNKKESQLSSDGSYIVLSASKDNEKSINTNTGSIFTKAFYKQYKKNNNLDIKFDEITRRITRSTSKFCEAAKVNVYHPQLSTSDIRLKFSTMNNFLE